MFGGAYFFENVADVSACVDQIGCPKDAIIFSAHHFLWSPRFIHVAYDMAYISQQRKWQLIFLFEFDMRRNRIRAYSQDLNPGCLIRGIIIPEIASLFGTAWRIIRRIKVKD